MKGKVYFIDTVHSILEERLNTFGFECVDLNKSDYNTARKNISIF